MALNSLIQSLIESKPNWPRLFQPHANTRPQASKIKTWPPPPLIERTLFDENGHFRNCCGVVHISDS